MELALSEETAHSTVYHHLSQLSVEIQVSGLIKFREESGVQIQLTDSLFTGLDGIRVNCHNAAVSGDIQSSELKKTVRVSCFRTGQKLSFSQLPNHHGTT